MSSRARRRQEERARMKARAARPPLRRRIAARIPAPLRSRWFWIPVLAAVVGGAGLTTWARLQPLPPPAPPEPSNVGQATSFRAVYQIRETAGETPNVNTEIVEAVRPYSTRIETREGRPPGGDILSGSATSREFFWSFAKGGEVKFGIRRQPAGMPRDDSLQALRDAVGAGAAKLGGRKRVLGRPCTVFLYKDLRPQPLQAPTKGDRVDSCVTDDGILLREEWRIKGKLVLVRSATAVESPVTIDPARFFVGATPPTNETSALIAGQQSVTEDKVPSDQAILHPKLPRGFALDRKATLFDAGGGRGVPRNAYIETYARGLEVLVVEQGRWLTPRPPWSATEGLAVDYPERGPGRLVFYADHVELRFSSAEGQDQSTWIRIQAPSKALAVYAARTMR